MGSLMDFANHKPSLQDGKICGVNVSLLLLFTLLLLAVTCFSGVINHTFIDYDDYRIIVDRIDTFDGLTLSNIKKIVLTDYPREEPLILRDLSYLLNAALFGSMNPQGFLLGNILLHCGVSFLVSIVSLVLLPGRHFTAFVAACLFLVHPIHVESVVWISSRKDPLYVFFYLSSFCCFAKYFVQGGERDNKLLFWAYILFICSLFSKSAAVSFLPIVLVYRYLLKKNEPIRKTEVVFYTFVLISTLVFVKWYSGILEVYGIISSGFTFDRDWLLWFYTSSVSIVFYLKKIFFPIDLSIIYEYPLASNVLSRPITVVASVATLATTFILLVILYFKKYYSFVFCGLFFVIALLPYLDLISVNIYVADRYLYLASVSFCILIAFFFEKVLCLIGLWSYRGYGVLFLVAIVMSIYVYQARQTTANWKNSITLWSNALTIAPNRIYVYSSLMRAYIHLYIQNYGTEYGVQILKEGERVGRHAYEKFCNLSSCPEQIGPVLMYSAEVFWQLGDDKLATEFFKKALAVSNERPDVHFMYASYLIDRKKYEPALKQLKLTLSCAHAIQDAKVISDIHERLLPLVEGELK